MRPVRHVAAGPAAHALDVQPERLSLGASQSPSSAAALSAATAVMGAPVTSPACHLVGGVGRLGEDSRLRPERPGLGVVGAAAVGIIAVRRLFYFFYVFLAPHAYRFLRRTRRSSAPLLSRPASPHPLASPPPHPRPRHRPSRVRRVRPLRLPPRRHERRVPRAVVEAAVHGLRAVPRHGLVPRRHVARQHRDILQARIRCRAPGRARGPRPRRPRPPGPPSCRPPPPPPAAPPAPPPPAPPAAPPAGAATAAAATTAAAAAETRAIAAVVATTALAADTGAPLRIATANASSVALRARACSAPAPQRAGRWAAPAASPTPCAGRPPTRPAPA